MSKVEKYLQNVAAGLSRLPENDKNEIIGEIRNHIHEAESRQEPVEAVLDKLGSPQKLAQSYINIHNANSGDMGFDSVWKSMVEFLPVGLSIFVVPILFLGSLGFLLSAVFLIGYSILDLFVNLPGGILQITDATGETLVVGFSGIPAVAIASVIALIVFGFSLLCWKLLKKYLVSVSQRYQKLRMEK